LKALAAACLILSALAPLGTVHAAARPTLTVSPAQTSSGGGVSFTGSGYTPGAEVVLVAGQDAIILARARADASGVISGAFVLPDEDLQEEATDVLPVYAVETGSGARSQTVRLDLRAQPRTGAERDTVEVHFSLRLQEAGSGDTSYWVLYGPPGARPTARRLTDPEGDGTLSFSTDVPAGSPLRARIVAAASIEDTATGPAPASPATEIEDFGEVTPATDLRLEAMPPQPGYFTADGRAQPTRGAETPLQFPISLAESGAGRCITTLGIPAR
jgi:hypothetical protein